MRSLKNEQNSVCLKRTVQHCLYEKPSTCIDLYHMRRQFQDPKEVPGCRKSPLRCILNSEKLEFTPESLGFEGPVSKPGSSAVKTCSSAVSVQWFSISMILFVLTTLVAGELAH